MRMKAFSGLGCYGNGLVINLFFLSFFFYLFLTILLLCSRISASKGVPSFFLFLCCILVINGLSFQMEF